MYELMIEVFLCVVYMALGLNAGRLKSVAFFACIPNEIHYKSNLDRLKCCFGISRAGEGRLDHTRSLSYMRFLSVGTGRLVMHNSRLDMGLLRMKRAVKFYDSKSNSDSMFQIARPACGQ